MLLWLALEILSLLLRTGLLTWEMTWPRKELIEETFCTESRGRNSIIEATRVTQKTKTNCSYPDCFLFTFRVTSLQKYFCPEVAKNPAEPLTLD